GLEFFDSCLACMSGGVIAVPAYLPRRNRKVERLLAIAEVAPPPLILTTRQLLATVETNELGNVNGLVCLATDAIEAETDGGRHRLHQGVLRTERPQRPPSRHRDGVGVLGPGRPASRCADSSGIGLISRVVS